jgi:hypothetical protein
LDVHYKTGYTQYIKFARVFGGSNYAVDLVNDTYLLIDQTIRNGGCKLGVSHHYIIRSLKLNYHHQARIKKNFDNYDKVTDMMLLDDENQSYLPEEIEDERLRRLVRELQWRTILSFVENNFNAIEVLMFEMKYHSGFSYTEIRTVLSNDNYKYSKVHISSIFKRIHEALQQRFNSK